MDVLWVTSAPLRLFLVPSTLLIVSANGNILPEAESFERQVSDGVLPQLCKQADALVYVAVAEPYDPAYFAGVCDQVAKVVVISEGATPSSRAQFSEFNVDGYVSAAMLPQDFSLAMTKFCDDKRAFCRLQEELKNFSNVAFTAMSSASEMGIVATYAEKVQEVMSINRLADVTFTSLRDLSLGAVIQFSFGEDLKIFPESASLNFRRLLENSINANARIISHGRFLLFSFTHVQLLIIDAPIDDADRYGRMRDVLAHFMSIAEARAKTLRVNELLKDQQDNTRTVMALLAMASSDNRNAVKDIMSKLSLSLRDMAIGLDLTLAQESALLGLSEGALCSLELLQESTMAVEEHFRSLVDQLDVVASLLDAPHVTHSSAEGAATESESSDANVCFF